jgi:hypothetical protein
MTNQYLSWPFEIKPNGDIVFGDPSTPDRFFMQEGDKFLCEFKNGRTVLVKQPSDLDKQTK